MKQYHLLLTVSITVNSSLSGLSQTIQEFEQNTVCRFSDTENVMVTDTEILKTPPFDPNRSTQ